MGARFSAPVHTGLGAHPASYTMGTGSFPGVKRQERGVDHPPHLAPRLKEEYSYTSAPPLGFVVCSGVKFTFLAGPTSLPFNCAVRCFVFGKCRTYRSWRMGLLGVVKWRGGGCLFALNFSVESSAVLTEARRQ